MAWNALPVELKLQIGQYVDRETLKSLRLADRFHHSIATPALFETVHISPNALSFKRANTVADNKDLAKHVTNLVYHVGTLSESYTDSNENFRSEVMSSFPRGYRPGDSRAISESYIQQKWKNYLDEIQAQRDFEALNEITQLKLLLLKLPFLDSVVALLDEYPPFGELDGYIEQRTGMPTQIDDEPHTDRLLRVLFNLPLKSLELGVLGWGLFMQNIDMSGQLHSSAQQYLPGHLGGNTFVPWKLENLHLGLYNSEYLEYEDQFNVGPKTFSNFLLHYSSNVHSLSLDFDELPFDWQEVRTPYQKIKKISGAIFMHTWHSLRRLSLRGIVTREDDLVHFLSRHAPSLKELSLGDIEIMHQSQSHPKNEDDDDTTYQDLANTTTDDDPTNSPGSIISLFYRLHASPLRLRKCTLHGNFTNRYTEAFYAHPPSSSSSSATISTINTHTHNTTTSNLLGQFEAFLCHASPSPYPDWPTFQALHRPIYDLKAAYAAKPSSPITDYLAYDNTKHALLAEVDKLQSVPLKKEWCDESWEWCPELVVI